MENKLKEEGAMAPITPAKPVSFGFESSNKGTKNEIHLDMNKSIPSIEGRDFADMSGKNEVDTKTFCNSGYELLRNLSFPEILCSFAQVDQPKTSEVKTSSSDLCPPMNSQADVNQSINDLTTPPVEEIKDAPQATDRDGFVYPPTPAAMNTRCFVTPPTQAAHRVPMNNFHTPAVDQEDSGVNKKQRQPQQRRRMKKHRPKVVVDWKLRKASNPPKTPKAPKTPKTPKAPKTPRKPKQKLCKRNLNLDLNEPAKVEEDDQALCILKDDLQEEEKNGLKGSEDVLDGVQLVNGVQIADIDNVMDDVQLVDNMLDNVINKVQLVDDVVDGVQMVDDMLNGVQLADTPDREFNLDDVKSEHTTPRRSGRKRNNLFMNNFVSSDTKIIQEPYVYTPTKIAEPCVYKPIRISESIKYHPVTNNKGHSENSLKVYFRRYRCEKNSRKIGPNFPRICKKHRMRRQKRAVIETLLVHMQTNRRHYARKVNTEIVQKGLQTSLASGKKVNCVLNWGNQRKRSKISTRKQILSSPNVDIISPDQVFPERDQRNVILPPPTDMNVNHVSDQFLSFHLGHNLVNENLPSPNALNPSDSLSLPKHHDQFSTPLDTIESGIDGNQSLLPLSQDQGILRHEMDISVTECGKQIPKVFTPRQSLYSPVQNTMESTDIEDCVPAHQRDLCFDESSTDLLDKLMELCEDVEALHIRDECSKQLVVGDQKLNPPKRHKKTRDKYNKQLVPRDQNANGEIVKFDPPKRQKKPEVELDHETLKISKFLQDNEGSSPFEEMDYDKEYWDKERNLFMGRICSFLQRTRYLLGNRSFLRWKGSVLDSIIGVFLTQNVTDVASSSTFMHLAAKFPPKTTSNNKETGDSEKIMWSHESVGSSKSVDGQPHDEKGIQLVGEKGIQFEMGNQDEILATKLDTISNTIPGVSSRGSLGDGNVADDLEKICKDSFDQNISSWDPLRISGGNSVEEKNKKQKHDASLGKKGKVKGKKAKTIPKIKKTKVEENIDWDELRKKYSRSGVSSRDMDTMDCVDWEAVRCSKVDVIAEIIKKRGMHNELARKIKGFIDRAYKDHGSLDLEWLRDVPPEEAKKYLLSIEGIGLKSTECIRLLCLHHVAFPVDTNVARVAVRLGWAPLQPLPESISLSDLNAFPKMDSIQQYLWPRLRTLLKNEKELQLRLYELHYQMITFGKVFCTMKKPKCKACPMQAECKYYASKYPSEKKMVSDFPALCDKSRDPSVCEPLQEKNVFYSRDIRVDYSPSPGHDDIEADLSYSRYYVDLPPERDDLDLEALLAIDPEDCRDQPEVDGDQFEDDETSPSTFDGEENLLTTFNHTNSLTKEVASSSAQKPEKANNVTIHQVYDLPDSHRLLDGFERRQPNVKIPYLLAIWTSATSEAVESEACNESSSASCTSIQELNTESIWGTILIPCQTATRWFFPLNGTYFQVNEVFADDESSREPIRVSRADICNLKTRILFCGTNVSTLLSGFSWEGIRHCFRKGVICVRGFDKTTRMPHDLDQRFHKQKKKSGVLGKRKRQDDK